METAKLTINRTVQTSNVMRSIVIFLDDRKIDTISTGESKTFEIPSGEHYLHAKIDWCKSESIFLNLLPGQEKKIELGSSAGSSHFKHFSLFLRFIIFFGV